MNISPNTTIQELLELKIISVRAFNVCRSKDASLNTAGDIKKFVDSGNSFLNLKNCGRKSATELLFVAANITLDEPKYIENNLPNNIIEDRFSALDSELRQIFIDEYELFVNDPSKEDRIISIFRNLFPKPSYLYDFQNNPRLLQNNGIIASLDSKYQYLIRKGIQSTISEIGRQISKKFGIDNSCGLDYVAFVDTQKEQCKPSFIDFYCYELSDDIHNFLDAKLKESIFKSSGIVKSFHKAYFKSTLDLIPFLECTIEEFVRKFGKKKGTIHYYHQILAPFRDLVHKIIDNPDKDKSIKLRVYYKFPFIDDMALDLILRYYSEYQSFPLFFILLEYLRNSDKREHQIFCMRFGLNDGEPKSLEEIALEFNLSRERIRQILTKPILEQTPLSKIDDWKQYFNEDILFFSSESEYFKTIIRTEKLQLHFEAFAQLYCSFFSYKYFDEYGCQFIVSSRYAKPIKKAFATLSKLQENNFSEDTYITYSAIFPDVLFKNPLVYNLILTEVAKCLEIKVVNEAFLFEQNFIDVEKEVYDFLYQKGEPIHIDLIQKYLQDKYPDKHFALPSLKAKICCNQNIVPVGKTSLYKLKIWRNIFSGNIRDLIREIMNNRDLPIDLDELTDKVTDVFETNKKNIHSSISGCDDFIPFGNGVYGLRGKIYPPEYVEVDLSRLRASFDERFIQYKSFVEQYQHIPYASGEDEEESLKRWQFNVYKKVLDVTDEQVELLKSFINANKHLPCNGIEYNFYRTCHEYLDYVKENFELPTRTNATSLYNWFYKQKSLASDYEDNRKRFFEELISELRSYGFLV